MGQEDTTVTHEFQLTRRVNLTLVKLITIFFYIFGFAIVFDIPKKTAEKY